MLMPLYFLHKLLMVPGLDVKALILLNQRGFVYLGEECWGQRRPVSRCSTCDNSRSQTSGKLCCRERPSCTLKLSHQRDLCSGQALLE